MGVDRRRARLQPDPRRLRCPGDGFPYDSRRTNTRFENHGPAPGRVAAVDAAPGQVDDDVTPIDLACPRAERFAIPGDGAARTRMGPAADHHDVVAFVLERSRQDGADLPRPAGDDDLHDASPGAGRSPASRSTPITRRRTGRINGSVASRLASTTKSTAASIRRLVRDCRAEPS